MFLYQAISLPDIQVRTSTDVQTDAPIGGHAESLANSRSKGGSDRQAHDEVGSAVDYEHAAALLPRSQRHPAGIATLTTSR